MMGPGPKRAQVAGGVVGLDRIRSRKRPGHLPSKLLAEAANTVEEGWSYCALPVIISYAWLPGPHRWGPVPQWLLEEDPVEIKLAWARWVAAEEYAPQSFKIL